MKVEGPGRIQTGAAGTRRASAPGTFTLPTLAPQTKAAGTSAARAMPSLDALMALQEFDPQDRKRKRQVNRGRTLLDALDGLKIALIEGRVSESHLNQLRATLAEAREASGDPGLDGVLADIELRAEVEIAKLTKR